MLTQLKCISISRGPGTKPTPAVSIGHMVLLSGPKKLRTVYIGQADLISQMTPIHLKT